MIEETLPLSEIREILSSEDDSKFDIVKRMRALFDARHHDTPEAIEVLASGLFHHSVLLRHEIAYVMGQMSQACALPILIKLLDDRNEHPMVRHEAGEAIAALGDTCQEAFDALQRSVDDENQAVRETCELALIGLKRTLEKRRAGKDTDRQRWDPSKGFYIFTASARMEKLDKSEFGTCDPAEGEVSMQKEEHVAELAATLMDEKNASLWDRYRAMFTLRNIASRSAAAALAAALDEKSSALLRHEICFVLGQLQLPVALPKLVERLSDTEEAAMVRHEAALSLGSVGADRWTAEGREARRAARAALREFAKDPDPIVWESCLTGLENIRVETGDEED